MFPRDGYLFYSCNVNRCQRCQKRKDTRLKTGDGLEINLALGLAFFKLFILSHQCVQLYQIKLEIYSKLTDKKNACLPPTTARDSSRYSGNFSRTSAAVHFSTTYVRWFLMHTSVVSTYPENRLVSAMRKNWKNKTVKTIRCTAFLKRLLSVGTWMFLDIKRAASTNCKIKCIKTSFHKLQSQLIKKSLPNEAHWCVCTSRTDRETPHHCHGKAVRRGTPTALPSTGLHICSFPIFLIF